MKPIFDVDNVTLRFGGVTSLNQVSLSQERGEILAIIGPNGAGKTSLFNCLTGVYRPQEGSIVFRPDEETSVSIVGRKPHRVTHAGVARTFQTSRMFNALTTFENVKVGVEARQRTGPISAMLQLPLARREERASDARARELLEFVELTHRMNTLADSLPYGDRRRLEIARALGTSPKVLLLDEPAAGLSPAERVGILELLKSLPKDLTLVMIEHDLDVLRGAVDSVAVLHLGGLVMQGSMQQVQQDERVRELYLGKSGVQP